MIGSRYDEILNISFVAGKDHLSIDGQEQPLYCTHKRLIIGSILSLPIQEIRTMTIFWGWNLLLCKKLNG